VGAGALADRKVESLNRSIVAWALSRGLGLAIATCVVALILATTLSDEAAERLATTAYVAMIFAAIVFFAARIVPATQDHSSHDTGFTFPAFLGYAGAVVVCVSVLAALVSQPGAEVLAIGAGFGLLAAAALVRAGAPASLKAALLHGGVKAATVRCAALVAAGALAVAAFLPEYEGGIAARFAYWVAIIATLALGASIVAPTAAGLWMRRGYARVIRRLDRAGEARFFARSAAYAAGVSVASIIVTVFLPAAVAKPLAVIAYFAAAAAAVSLAMECRRMRASSGIRRA